ncbi:hypothetical protein [Streptomyces wedmorensis]
MDLLLAEHGAGSQLRLLLAEHGAGSQLRLLLADARGVWGVLRLLRSAGTRPFGEDDARQAVRLRDALVAALRRYGTSGPPCPESDAPVLAPGVVVVGADHRVKAVSPHARAGTSSGRAGAGTSFRRGCPTCSSPASRSPHGPAASEARPRPRWCACRRRSAAGGSPVTPSPSARTARAMSPSSSRGPSATSSSCRSARATV